VPVLRDDVVAGLHDPEAMELDVAAIHQRYVRAVSAGGGAVRTSCRVRSLAPGPPWTVTVDDGDRIEADVIVDAAGAWGDAIAAMAGVAPVGLRPLRRTVAVVSLPDDVDAAGWPLVGFEQGDGSMDGYCKPEPGGLLVSPADETPSQPCDARPEEIDIALALDALAQWTTLEGRHVRSSWAGLRSFVADRDPVIGFAPDAPGFFWAIGQGGYGIQMAPALARAAVGLIVDGALPDDLVTAGLAPADLRPDRTGLDGELTAGH
jgi:D-arginine dehydrogenase